MKRAALILTVAGGLLVALLAAAAQQQPGKAWRIGVLLTIFAPDAAPPQAFRQRLRELGYVEGQNIAIEWRYAQGKDERLPGLAAELVQLKVDLIVADVTTAIRAAMQATSTIPIVMTNSADAERLGIVSNLGHPGGNVTGVTTMLAELSAKRLQLFKEAVPTISRVAVLWNPGIAWHNAMLKEVEVVAPSLQIKPLPIAVKSRDELGDVFSEITRGRVDALFVNHTASPNTRGQLLAFAAKRRLPTMFGNREYVPAGGLMSYGVNFPEMFRHAAAYVDRILKGVKPGDLPVEQPTRFELLLNMRTAKALGLTIPPSVLARADEVIQ